MAFMPLSGGTSTALSGTVVSPRFLSIGRYEDDVSPVEELAERRPKTRGSPRDNPKSIESDLIKEYKRIYIKRPFANLQG